MAKEQTHKDIELLKEHTDGGRDYPVGAKLTLDAAAAEWLVQLGVAKYVA